MATSCIAPKVLCTSRMPVSSVSCDGRFNEAQMSSVTTSMTCVPTIHARRRPKRSDAITSITGPKAHLKAQGR